MLKKRPKRLTLKCPTALFPYLLISEPTSVLYGDISEINKGSDPSKFVIHIDSPTVIPHIFSSIFVSTIPDPMIKLYLISFRTLFGTMFRKVVN